MNKSFVFLICLISLPVYSYDWAVNGKITVVEPTQVPNLVKLQISEAAGPCPKGTWLIWEGKTSNPEANVQAIYSAALSALMGGKEVRLYGANDCKLEFMHILHN